MQRGWVVSADYRAVIKAISNARKECGVSQRELARRLGKHPSFVNKTEQLERRLDILEFIAIAEALELDPMKLLATVRECLPGEIEI